MKSHPHGPPRTRIILGLLTILAAPLLAGAQPPAGEGPAIRPPRITQAMIASGQLNLRTIRTHGLRIFATPFNKLDGLGDGPMNPSDPTSPGGRPTLQNNGMFLRVNGLDAQTCMECHSILSASKIPFHLGIGGVGGANNNAMAGATLIDVSDGQGNGFASFNGRFINPPFLMGSGGVELVGKEMTAELQSLKLLAQNNPGTSIPLVTKGVNFGTITYTPAQGFDTSGVVGIDPDLVVRPFGRKGEFATARDFDVGALQFHLGMQPVEVVGAGQDPDNDGVADEILVGELSALHIFDTTLEPPVREHMGPLAQMGFEIFDNIGCANCHIPEITTSSSILTYSFPEVHSDPAANIYYAVNLRHRPTRFKAAPGGGIRVPMFSDLKRHDMGPALAESTGGPLDPFFITARLWGIADTAPYLHDGRATTLTDAILMHGGEALAARNAFDALSQAGKRRVLAFLRTLRTPRRTAKGLRVSSL